MISELHSRGDRTAPPRPCRLRQLGLAALAVELRHPPTGCRPGLAPRLRLCQTSSPRCLSNSADARVLYFASLRNIRGSLKVACAWCLGERKAAIVREKEPFDDPEETHRVCPEHKVMLPSCEGFWSDLGK